MKHHSLTSSGSKYYLKIHEPTDKQLYMSSIIELTSPMPWDKQSQLSFFRRSKRKLNNYSKEEIKDWSERFNQIPAFIAKKTLESTTQFMDTVEAETRTMPHQHFKVRMPFLTPRRCQEGFHSDTPDQQEDLSVDTSLLVPRVPILMLI